MRRWTGCCTDRSAAKNRCRGGAGETGLCTSTSESTLGCGSPYLLAGRAAKPAEVLMTETISPPETTAPVPPIPPRPETDAAAVRAIEEASAHIRERAQKIRECPELHIPRLVLSKHVRGTSLLDKIADAVN